MINVIRAFLATHPAAVDFIDLDRDGQTAATGDCDGLNNTVYTGAQEIPNDGVDQNCDGADWTYVLPDLIVWFASTPGVSEASPGDDRVYFGTWGVLTASSREVDVRRWTFKVQVSDNPTDIYPGYTNNTAVISPRDYLQNCVLVNTQTGSVVAGPIDPDANGLLDFVDEFTVTGVPLMVDAECDFTTLVPPTTYGFALTENVGVSVDDNWEVEDVNGDEVLVSVRNLNRTGILPNVVAHVLP